ncbi:glycoside hydrolase family 127 protein [Microbacterium arborescens]
MTISIPSRPAAERSFSARLPAAPVIPSACDRVGAGIDEVTLDADGFWGRRQRVNATNTLAHCVHWMAELGWLANFDRVAAGELTIERAGWMFSDSEVYKLLEAMAWELGRTGDPALTETYDSLVRRVAAAQSDDGYIGTAFGHPGLPPRYSDLAMGHELYNIGHLLQAAVARLRTHGEDLLVAVARRAADHVCDEFGARDGAGICGHPEIEVALAEFARATGDERYLEQSRLFVERRGHGSLPVRPLLSAEYFQDDTPVRAASVLRGHAVRALYLSAGAVDVAVETGDTDLLDALREQWRRTVERRTYITGGMGSRHQDEGFGDDFELPADRAYCETCAGVASVMFSWRLYLATGELEYVDLIERTLFNIVATSPSDDGRAFFYANPLHERHAGQAASDGVNMRAEGGTRAPWFDVSCCPTNVARTVASLSAYVAALDGDAVAVLQYTSGTIRLGGFEIEVQTRYPDDGHVRLIVAGAPDAEATLRLRIPSWAGGARISVAGAEERTVDAGWADVRRVFAPGDVIDLHLPTAPRLTFPDPRVDAVRGTVAVESGPLVLCLESADLPAGVSIDDILVDPGVDPSREDDGARVHAVTVAEPSRRHGQPPFGDGPQHRAVTGRAELTLIPYHRWAERGPSTMRVFLPLADR